MSKKDKKCLKEKEIASSNVEELLKDALKNGMGEDNQKDNSLTKVYVKKYHLEYYKTLRTLQVELLKFQNYVKEEKLKVLLVFEGRDAAGKGGCIQRFTQHLNPRGARVVALEKPTEKEKSEWYFQRYIKHLPYGGEIVFFDRSWYNRAGVETVFGFCTQEENREFLRSVGEFEKMLVSSGVILVKFYFSISKKEQHKRLKKRIDDPLRRYKISAVDKQAQDLWDKYTIAKYSMLLSSNTPHAPWTVIKADNKKRARLNTIKYFLSSVDYPNKINQIDTDKDIVLTGEKEIEIMERNIQDAI